MYLQALAQKDSGIWLLITFGDKGLPSGRGRGQFIAMHCQKDEQPLHSSGHSETHPFLKQMTKTPETSNAPTGLPMLDIFGASHFTIIGCSKQVGAYRRKQSALISCATA